jgi:hypothetical protein
MTARKKRIAPGLLVPMACIAVAGALLLVLRPWQSQPDTPDGPEDLAQARRPRPAGQGFVESARVAGLDFRMQFLPQEQGLRFKANLYDHGCGVAVGDYNGDGSDDVLFLNQFGPNGLFRNRGDGTFVRDQEAEETVGLNDRVCVGATFADYDNDGDQDLYVTSTRGGNVLFRNDGPSRFVDVTDESGLTLVKHSQTPAFFDYDNDGDLDLLVTNSAEWTAGEYDAAKRYYPGVNTLFELVACKKETNNFFRNEGNGRFVDITAQSGLAGAGWGGDTAVFDVDHDGWLDVLIANMFGTSQLFRNDGEGAFRDATQKLLGFTSFGPIGAKAFDFNNDGQLDLMMTDMHSDMWMPPDYDMAKVEPAARYQRLSGALPPTDPTAAAWAEALEQSIQIDYSRAVFGNTLFRAFPDARYEEVAPRAGAETLWPWGLATGDFDGDGYEDAFLPSGMGYPFAYWPNALLMNQQGEKFVDRAYELGIEPPAGGTLLEESLEGVPAARSSRCAATADFDHDGRLDLVVNNFNDAPYYFRNKLPQNNYLAVRLTGTRSNRDAIGAVVRVHVAGDILTRQVQAAGGYLSQSSKTLHFAFGKHDQVERMEIRWPMGRPQTIERPDINVLLEVTEPT